MTTAVYKNTLVIVESPAKCAKIEHYLNTYDKKRSTFKCIASYGHLRELAGGIAAIDIHHNFSPTFIIADSKKERVHAIQKAILNADEIILATDDDREGEAIAWHICQLFKLPVETTKRIIFHEITEMAIQRAIENPTHVKMDIVNAQLARQVLDILVGYKLSPLLWKHVKDGISAGRCQSPVLRLIYENQQDMDKAPGRPYYKITGYFTAQNLPFILNHEAVDENCVRAFLQESVGFSHMFNTPTVRSVVKTAPMPFSTSSLQQTSSSELHLSPNETMRICQTLYEGGYITYPRTDGTTYSAEFMSQVQTYITQMYGKEYVRASSTGSTSTNGNGNGNGTAVQDKESAHEAIRPTKITCENIEENANFTTKDRRVYSIIRRRTLESCMSDATVSVLSASITAPQEREYRYATEQVIFMGWQQQMYSSTNNSDKTNNKTADYHFLQLVKPLVPISAKKIKAEVHVKELKSHYTEASLVKEMELRGIGRPSTFSSLVEKIQERKYVKKENIDGNLLKCVDLVLEKDKITATETERTFGNEKGKLVIQPLGILCIEFLLKYFDKLFQYTYTKEMEDELDLVAKREKIWHEVCRKCYIEIENLSELILERGKETIRIDVEHTYMIGKYGPVIKCEITSAGAAGAMTSAAGAMTSAAAATKKTKAYAPKVVFKPVKKNIDINKLRRGEYTLDQVLASETEHAENGHLGMYKDKPVYIKSGKYGMYLEWNNTNHSLHSLHLKKKIGEIELDDVIEVLYDNDNETAGAAGDGGDGGDESDIPKPCTTRRIISDNVSIRKGQYGDYIFYKTSKMRKPRFLKLEGFAGTGTGTSTGTGTDYMTCDVEIFKSWFKDKYKIAA